MCRTSEAKRSKRREAAQRSIYKRLKPGPSNSSAEVKESQRSRLRRAMVELVAELGYRGVTVRELSRVAGVSTGTFYSHFRNVEECLVAACAWFLRDASRQTREVSGNDSAAVRGRTETLLQIFADDPEAAGLALIESRPVCAANAGVQGPMQSLDRRLLREVALGLGGSAVPLGVAEAIAAGVMNVARSKLLVSDFDGLRRTADDLGLWAFALCEGGTRGFGNGVLSLVESVEPDPVPPPRDRRGERDRILSATIRAAMSGGYGELTIPKIRAEAGVSRRRFNELFASPEETFLAAVEDRFAVAVARAKQGARVASSWYSKVVQVTVALSREFARDPALARLAFLEVYAAGRRGVELVNRLILRCADCLRSEVPVSRRPSPVFTEASVGAAWGLVTGQVKAGRGKQLADLSPTLAFVLLAPILGAETAARASAG